MEQLPEDVVKALDLPVSSTILVDGDFIVLLDSYAAPKKGTWENLLRVTPAGTILWRASSAKGRYTEVRCVNADLTAWTWEGSMVRIDPATGSILEATFVK